MTSYLRSWISGAPPTIEASSSSANPAVDITIEDDNDDGEDTEREDNNVPPAFPALNSAQRASSAKQTPSMPRVLNDADLMPPPPLPTNRRTAPSSSSSFLSAPSTSASSLSVPSTMTRPPTRPASSKKRDKVALKPGHSALDWANLKASGENLRGPGVESLMRIPPSILRQHNKRDDAWSVFNGKVYNITQYLPFHPGGERELMRVAGRDGTQLFAATHSWVNAEFMLDSCLVGFLVSESSS